jgi:hypothetical protein
MQINTFTHAVSFEDKSHGHAVHTLLQRHGLRPLTWNVTCDHGTPEMKTFTSRRDDVFHGTCTPLVDGGRLEPYLLAAVVLTRM